MTIDDRESPDPEGGAEITVQIGPYLYTKSSAGWTRTPEREPVVYQKIRRNPEAYECAHQAHRELFHALEAIVSLRAEVERLKGEVAWLSNVREEFERFTATQKGEIATLTAENERLRGENDLRQRLVDACLAHEQAENNYNDLRQGDEYGDASNGERVEMGKATELRLHLAAQAMDDALSPFRFTGNAEATDD